jgi:hypothetical protein
MSPAHPDPALASNGKVGSNSVADELRQESEKLRQLAEQLKAQEEALAEMETNYPRFRQFVYARLREEFAKSLGELPPDTDLDTFALQQGALPLDAFIAEIELPADGP